MRKPSLYPTDRGCFVCGNPDTVTHHIYPGYGRRDISDEEGCTVRLCNFHHNMSNHGVHADRRLDSFFREDCQRRWEEREGVSGDGHEAFLERFRITYL